MKIRASIKIKRDHACIKCGKVSDNGGTIFISAPVCNSFEEIIEIIQREIDNAPKVDFPIGWSNFTEGLYCDECK